MSHYNTSKHCPFKVTVELLVDFNNSPPQYTNQNTPSGAFFELVPLILSNSHWNTVLYDLMCRVVILICVNRTYESHKAPLACRLSNVTFSLEPWAFTFLDVLCAFGLFSYLLCQHTTGWYLSDTCRLSQVLGSIPMFVCKSMFVASCLVLYGS